MSSTTITTKDLARMVAQKLELSHGTTENVLKEFQDAIVSHLAEGGEVRLTNFGTFKTINREAREARNPRTGEALTVPPQTAVRFVPGKNLKELKNATS